MHRSSRRYSRVEWLVGYHLWSLYWRFEFLRTIAWAWRERRTCTQVFGLRLWLYPLEVLGFMPILWLIGFGIAWHLCGLPVCW